MDELFGLVDFFLSPPKRNCSNIFLLTTILILSQIMTYMYETLPAFLFSVETLTILVELSCPAFVNHTHFPFLYFSNNMTIYLIQLCSPRKRKPVERLAEDGMPVPTGGVRPLDGIFFCISFTAAGSRECCGSRENSTTVVD